MDYSIWLDFNGFVPLWWLSPALLSACVWQCVWLSQPDHRQTVWSRRQLPEAHRRRVKRHQSPFQHGWKWGVAAGSGQSHGHSTKPVTVCSLLFVVRAPHFSVFTVWHVRLPTNTCVNRDMSMLHTRTHTHTRTAWKNYCERSIRLIFWFVSMKIFIYYCCHPQVESVFETIVEEKEEESTLTSRFFKRICNFCDQCFLQVLFLWRLIDRYHGMIRTKYLEQLFNSTCESAFHWCQRSAVTHSRPVCLLWIKVTTYSPAHIRRVLFKDQLLSIGL